MAYQPIRWDNIQSPSMGAPAQTLESASRMLNGAFAQFQQPLQQAQATDQQNWQTTKVNNTLDARAALLAYSDANKYKQGMESGAVADIINRYGAQADRGALMDLADQRLSTLQGRDIQGINYNNTLLHEKVSPIADAYKAAVQSKDAVGAAAALAKYREMGGKEAGDLLAYGNQTGHQFVTWDQEGKKFTQDMKLSDAQIKHMMNQDQYSRESLGIQRAGQEIQRAQMLQQFGTHLEDQMLKYSQAKSKLTPVSAASEEGGKLIADALSSLKDSAAQRNVGAAIAAFIQANPNAPASAIDTAIRTADQSWYKPDFMTRNQVTENAAALTKAAQQDASSQGKEEARNFLAGNMARLAEVQKTTQGRLYRTLFPQGANAAPAGVMAPITPEAANAGSDAVRTMETRAAAVRQQEGHYGPNGWVDGAAAPAPTAIPNGAIDVRNDPVVQSLRTAMSRLNPSKDGKQVMDIGTALNKRLEQLQEKYGSRTTLISQ